MREIEARARANRPFSIVVVAEGAAPEGGDQVYQRRRPEVPQGVLGGIGFQVAEGIQNRCGVETRVLVLGHLQRGGSPSPYDRLLGTRFGVQAVELVGKKDSGGWFL